MPDLLACRAFVRGEHVGELVLGRSAKDTRAVNDAAGEGRKFRFGGEGRRRENQQKDEPRPLRSSAVVRRRCAAKAHQNLTWGTCWLCSEMVKVSRTFISG